MTNLKIGGANTKRSKSLEPNGMKTKDTNSLGTGKGGQRKGSSLSPKEGQI